MNIYQGRVYIYDKKQDQKWHVAYETRAFCLSEWRARERLDKELAEDELWWANEYPENPLKNEDKYIVELTIVERMMEFI